MTSPDVRLRLWPGPVLPLVAGAELAALALLAGGWYGASAQVGVEHQFAWISLGVAGVLIAGVTNAGLLLVARYSIGRRRRLLEGAPPVAAPARGVCRP
ncbi:MAG TPA: hypothetical protein VG034_18355 [Acidimicrobiia bacterium]|jgi:hypothetical protein|nr:hypothetical protein [Acidimicrobiia bacterium]